MYFRTTLGTNRMLLFSCLSTWSLTMTSWRWSSQRTAVPRPGPDSGESLGSGQWSLRCEAGLCCRKTRKKICHCHYCHMRSMYWIMTTMLGFWGHWCNYALFALSALDVVLDAHKRHLVIYSYVVLTMTNNELISMTQKNNKFSTTMDHNWSHHGHLTAYLKMLMEANVDTCI